MPRPPTYRERYAAMLANQGEMRSYEPGLRERLTTALQGTVGEQKTQDVMNIAENAPYGPGTLMDIQDAATDIEQGNYLPGVAGMALAVAPIPGKKIIKETAKKAVKAGSKAAQKVADFLSSPYLINPVRDLKPGIYKRPDVIAKEAAAMTAPEDPALKELFGVTRDDLYEMGGRGTRKGNMPPQIASVKNPKGSYAAEQIMTPRNAQRIIDTLTEAKKHAPELVKGMDAWYVMDPAYQHLKNEVGEDEAKRLYSRFNTITSMHSPASDVLTEINRGTAANMMINRGEFGRYQKYGGMAEAKRGADFPEELRDVIGHPYHSTAHTGPVSRYLERGKVDMTQPKVPLYMQASGVPETGFQTTLPVPDAHFTRAIGMGDVRQNANPGVSMKMPEYAQTGPWFRENVADPLGIQAVPAQGRTWGVYAPQTGVDTAIGAPKLELIAMRVKERAKKLGIDPKALLDDVLKGNAHALKLLGLPAGVAAAAGLQGTTEEPPRQ